MGALIIPMSHNVCIMFFDIYPAVPHYLVCKVSVFGNAQRIYHTATAVVLHSAVVGLCVAEDDFGTARVYTAAHAWAFTPVVVPAAYPFYGQLVLILVVGTGILLGGCGVGDGGVVSGVTFAMQGKPDAAVICLIASGVCDMFDGTVARTAKRNDMQKAFGIQIDSLADVMSFGLLPAAIGYCLFDLSGNSSTFATVLTVGICSIYVLCGLMRLAWFNATEEEMQARCEKRTYYVGLPITVASLILSVAYFIIAGMEHVSCIYTSLLMVLAIAFISKFHMPKVKLQYVVVVAFVGLGVILLALHSRGVF